MLSSMMGVGEYAGGETAGRLEFQVESTTDMEPETLSTAMRASKEPSLWT